MGWNAAPTRTVSERVAFRRKVLYKQRAGTDTRLHIYVEQWTKNSFKAFVTHGLGHGPWAPALGRFGDEYL